MTWKESEIVLNRESLYTQAILRWDNHQVNMIEEETGELLTEIGNMLKFINKLKRKTENGHIKSSELIENEEFKEICFSITGELADFIIMLDQHNDGFMDEVDYKIFEKLERLKKRLGF